MPDTPNFILVPPQDRGTPAPQVPRPPCVIELLRHFETYCVVACCEWSALDLSEEHIRRLKSSGQASPHVIRKIFEDVLEWSKQLNGPVKIEPDYWYFDPKDAIIHIQDAVRLLDIIQKNDGVNESRGTGEY